MTETQHYSSWIIFCWSIDIHINNRFYDFQNELGLWEEVQGITEALQSGSASVVSQFHRDLFSHMLLGKYRFSAWSDPHQFKPAFVYWVFFVLFQKCNINFSLLWQKELKILWGIVDWCLFYFQNFHILLIAMGYVLSTQCVDKKMRKIVIFFLLYNSKT